MKTLTQQKTRRFASHADIPKTYRELCEAYLPRPIHDDAEDEEATAMMNALAVFTRLNTEQRDYLDVLTAVNQFSQTVMLPLNQNLSGFKKFSCLATNSRARLHWILN